MEEEMKDTLKNIGIATAIACIVGTAYPPLALLIAALGNLYVTATHK